jgi:hypothetical protein
VCECVSHHTRLEGDCVAKPHAVRCSRRGATHHVPAPQQQRRSGRAPDEALALSRIIPTEYCTVTITVEYSQPVNENVYAGTVALPALIPAPRNRTKLERISTRLAARPPARTGAERRHDTPCRRVRPESRAQLDTGHAERRPARAPRAEGPWPRRKGSIF